MTNLDFTQSVIKHDAARMDAAEFDNFIKDAGIKYEYMFVNNKDKNKDLYEVYLFDFDLTIHYVDGKFMNV